MAHRYASTLKGKTASARRQAACRQRCCDLARALLAALPGSSGGVQDSGGPDGMRSPGATRTVVTHQSGTKRPPGGPASSPRARTLVVPAAPPGAPLSSGASAQVRGDAGAQGHPPRVERVTHQASGDGSSGEKMAPSPRSPRVELAGQPDTAGPAASLRPLPTPEVGAATPVPRARRPASTRRGIRCDGCGRRCSPHVRRGFLRTRAREREGDHPP